MRKQCLGYLAAVTLIGSLVTAPLAYAADVQYRDLPTAPFSSSSASEAVVKWEIPLDSKRPNNDAIFKGYSLTVKAGKQVNGNENQWFNKGLFTVSYGKCGSQPADSAFKKIVNGELDLGVHPTSNPSQTLCVWGKLKTDAKGVYDRNGKRYTLDEANKAKESLKSDSSAYYRNDVTVKATGNESGEEVTDSDHWETFIESFKPFAAGEAKLGYEPEWFTPFTPRFPKTGGSFGTSLLVGAGSTVIAAVLCCVLGLARKRKL